MVKKQSLSGRTEFLFSMLLFFVFLFCSVFTVLIGSRVYENIRARDNESFYRDTALSYVVNKVRQADSQDAVSVFAEPDGTSVLVLTSAIGGAVYETWIYTKDGKLRELFTPEDSGLTTADGLPVSACPPLSFFLEETEEGQLLTICQKASSENGNEPPGQEISLLLRSSGNSSALPVPQEGGSPSGEGGF